ncbi:MAG TPA: hypothetical protein VG942_19280, partial [Hyphomonadaceae bacterium]|nr:hypothetical protein [Hyphomonadaceae bacterium]
MAVREGWPVDRGAARADRCRLVLEHPQGLEAGAKDPSAVRKARKVTLAHMAKVARETDPEFWSGLT